MEKPSTMFLQDNQFMVNTRNSAKYNSRDLKIFRQLINRYDKKLPPTKVFAKAWLDNVTSAMCKHQQRFGFDVQFSALVHNFSNIFSIGYLYRADEQ